MRLPNVVALSSIYRQISISLNVFKFNRPRAGAPAQKRYNCRVLLSTGLTRGFMRTILNILNFVLGGFATTLGWLLATLVSIILIFTLPLTRSCWEITRLSLFPYGNEAIHVDELEPEAKTVY